MRTSCRLFSFALALLPVAVGCAAPTPDDAVAGSEGAFVRPDSDGAAAKIDYVDVHNLVEYNQIFETVSFPAGLPNQAVDVCHAYQNGTDAQKHACDNYPTNYTAMPCSLQTRFTTDPEQAKLVFPTCTGGGNFGKAPYDQGDGAYRVFFVNHNDPTDRRDASVSGSSDFFQVSMDYGDYPQVARRPDLQKYVCDGSRHPQFYSIDSFVLVTPGQVTKICPRTLRLKLEMKKGFASQVKACATGYSTEGMTPEQIAAKDEEQIKQCEANATNTLEGRDGWIKYSGANADRETLNWDGSDLLAPKLHLIFSFALNGRVESYVFDNDYTPPAQQ